MTAFWIACATCILTLAGGFLAVRFRTYQGVLFAFCAGALMAGALMEILPDALELLESADSAFHHHHLLLACVLGFLCFYLLEYATHNRETPAVQESHHAHAPHAGVLGAMGIVVHSLIDGFAIGKGFHIHDQVGWAIAIGVTLHKLADGASVAGLMLGTQHSTRATTAMLGVTAIAPIFGVLLQGYVALATPQLALLLGWFAGVFLYLGAGSLLPAAHDASHSRLLPLATLAGVVFIYGAQLLAHH
jgi:ZIP family zinc transporter